MTNLATKAKVTEQAREVGLYVATWSPGDGMTRYRFFAKPSDYFGPENGIYTALGAKEAGTFIEGYAYGKGADAKVRRQLLDALVGLVRKGKFGQNPYTVPEFKAALVAVAEATGFKGDWMDALETPRLMK